VTLKLLRRRGNKCLLIWRDFPVAFFKRFIFPFVSELMKQVILMAICEICENEVSEIFDCKECGAKFCDKCGDIDRNLCEDCLQYIEAYDISHDVEVEG
jgi:hypothetical protein